MAIVEIRIGQTGVRIAMARTRRYIGLELATLIIFFQHTGDKKGE